MLTYRHIKFQQDHLRSFLLEKILELRINNVVPHNNFEELKSVPIKIKFNNPDAPFSEKDNMTSGIDPCTNAVGHCW